MHTYSAFWLAWAAGLICLSPVWAGRGVDDQAEPPVTSECLHPAEVLTMQQWLRLGEHERLAIVATYSTRRLKPAYLSSDEKRRQVSLAAD